MKKHIFTLAFSSLLISCGNGKETTEETVESVTEETTEVTENSEEEIPSNEGNYRIIGIVHVSETDCPVYIEAQEENETVNYYPVNLEEKYKVEGMKIKFDYTWSKAPQPENCDVDKAIQVNDVTIMR